MRVDPRHPYLAELGLTLWVPRLERGQAAESFQAQTAAPAPEPQPSPAVEGVAEARADASRTDVALMDWDELEADLQQQDRRGASRAVFGVGARDADLLIVGEAPGADEDRQGEPFVGRAGKLLDRMLLAIGRDRRRNAYIANICKFRPPNNRDPLPEEVEADRPYLARQIELLQPKLIMAVGRVAAQNLLGSGESLGRMRRQVHRYQPGDIPVLVTYHPAYLLRSPQHKARAWDDLKAAMSFLEGERQ